MMMRLSPCWLQGAAITSTCLLILALVSIENALADVYLHNPRGSNGRNCETNDVRTGRNRLFDSQNNGAGGYACPRAWPFACYTLRTEAEREACNEQNADQDYDNISNLNLADNDGVLHPNGTRTAKQYFYEGSLLQIEWSQNHGCGRNPKSYCNIIIQYACEDTLTDDCGEPGSGKTCGPRDGVPITNSNGGVGGRGVAEYVNILNSGINRVERRERDREASAAIPVSLSHNAQSDPRFGRHESLQYYLKCRRRERNKGLWTADFIIAQEDGSGTRQNNGNERFGFECAEEAHYYPYWASSPWKDIAILTNRVETCPSLQNESQNVKDKFECVCPSCVLSNVLVPITESKCTLFGGAWVRIPSHNITAPFCGQAETTVENQLGGALESSGSLPSYKWKIPSGIPAGNTCVLRIRYNISTADLIPGTDVELTVGGTSAQNGNASSLRDRFMSEVDTYASFVEAPLERLGLAINTNQFGRTFQDRSYVFEIRKAPPPGGQHECAGKQIYNLNTRGKRGNIVQTFPALVYDFAPSELSVTESDCIHVQWTGSDYNPARNANDAYGGPPDPNDLSAGRSDRFNLVQIPRVNVNRFVASLESDFAMFNTTIERKRNLAFIGQPLNDPNLCMTIEAIANLSFLARTSSPVPPQFLDNGNNYLDDQSDRDRFWKNCGKLSGARTPYFDGGLFLPGPVGTYAFMNTRSHSFANRMHIGILHVVVESNNNLTEAPTTAIPATVVPTVTGNAPPKMGMHLAICLGVLLATTMALT